MGKNKDAYGVFLGKSEGKKPLLRWEDNTKWIFMKWDGGIDWIDLAQNRGRGGVCFECGSESLDSVKCGVFFD